MPSSRPKFLLVLAVMVVIEALALLAIVVVNAVGALGDKKVNWSLLLGGELIWLIGIGALLLIARGLLRRSASARTPFILAQLFALIMAYPLIRLNGLWIALGIALAAMALTGIVLALSPRAGVEFDQAQR